MWEYIQCSEIPTSIIELEGCNSSELKKSLSANQHVILKFKEEPFSGRNINITSVFNILLIGFYTHKTASNPICTF